MPSESFSVDEKRTVACGILCKSQEICAAIFKLFLAHSVLPWIPVVVDVCVVGVVDQHSITHVFANLEKSGLGYEGVYRSVCSENL